MRKVYKTDEDNIEDVRDEMMSYEYLFDHAVVKNPDGERIETENFDYLMDILSFYYNQTIFFYTREY